jgi:hypothetical protein
MARTCPACGSKAIDDQSQFCNKCGTPFPDELPRRILVRTTPRLAETPLPQQTIPPPVAEHPAPEPRASPVPPARSLADPPRVRMPAKTPARKQVVSKPVLPFKKYIARDFIKPIYWIGFIAILLIVFSGISADLAKKSTTTGTSAKTTESSSGDILAGIPFFWIGVLLIGNLFWRMFCEMCTILFALQGLPVSAGNAQSPWQDTLVERGLVDDDRSEEFTECPRCGKTVSQSELRTCAHCGVQGCSSCIRMMGLVRKTLTCRDCYQKK